MASFSHEASSTTRERFVLDLPTNWAEMDKAMSAARQRLQELGRDPGYDDAATINGDDEHVWVEIELETVSHPTDHKICITPRRPRL